MALQKTLLSFESNHGRPKEKQERLLMRPLYDRYRRVKRLLTTISTNKSPNRNPEARVRDLLRGPTGSDDSEDDEGSDKVVVQVHPTRIEEVRSSQIFKSSPNSVTMSLHSESGAAGSQPDVQAVVHRTGEKWASIDGNNGRGPMDNESFHCSSASVTNQPYHVAMTASVPRNFSSPKPAQNEWCKLFTFLLEFN